MNHLTYPCLPIFLILSFALLSCEKKNRVASKPPRPEIVRNLIEAQSFEIPKKQNHCEKPAEATVGQFIVEYLQDPTAADFHCDEPGSGTSTIVCRLNFKRDRSNRVLRFKYDLKEKTLLKRTIECVDVP